VSKRSLITFLALIVTVSACQLIEEQGRQYPSTIGTFSETGAYVINPTTILDSLNHGETNVFAPVLATPNDDSILPSDSIYWAQADYLKIANALSQFIWNETLDDWLVYYLVFERNCDDHPGGFYSADIIYYKTIGVGWQKKYTARWIQIYPLASIVYWGGDTDFPSSNGWVAIDLRKFKITADDALRIAEENGGDRLRSKVQNVCNISIDLPNNDKDISWDIRYNSNPFFEIIVDPYSGKYELLSPNP